MSQTIEILLREAAPSATEWLRLETGKPARVLSAQGERVIGEETLTRQAIISSVARIVPPDVRRRLPSEPLVEFEYDGGTLGRYSVTIERAPGDPLQLSVTATPLDSPAAAPPLAPRESATRVTPAPPSKPTAAPEPEPPAPVVEYPSQTGGVDASPGTDAPVIEQTSEPTPVIEHTSEPTPVTEHTSEPTPVTEHTSEPTPVTEHTSEPTPVIEHTSEPPAVIEQTAEPATFIDPPDPTPVFGHTSEPTPAFDQTAAPERPVTTRTDETRPAIEPAPQTAAPPPVEPPPPAEAVAPTPVRTPGQPAAIDELFHHMFEAGASDLHLSVGMPPLVRKDGGIQPLDDTRSPFEPDGLRQLLLEITSPKNRDEFDELHDTDFAYEISGLARFRANLFLDRKGIGAVFRVIPAEILTAEQLGLSPHILKLGRLTKGLVLVTGPTGSGKSTTLTALIDYINKNREDHIITIEDPIEFVHENRRCLVNQREVHTHTAGFKSALRAALREDPDILLVGEMRDLETISIAIETAETGHLVFGTLHTSTAASTVDRGVDGRPHDRSVSARPAGPDSRHAIGVAPWRDLADPMPEDLRGTHRRPGGADHQLGHQQPDPRGKDVPDPVDDAGRAGRRDGGAQRCPGGPRQGEAGRARRGLPEERRQGGDGDPPEAPPDRHLVHHAGQGTGLALTGAGARAR